MVDLVDATGSDLDAVKERAAYLARTTFAHLAGVTAADITIVDISQSTDRAHVYLRNGYHFPVQGRAVAMLRGGR